MKSTYNSAQYRVSLYLAFAIIYYVIILEKEKSQGRDHRQLEGCEDKHFIL